MKKNKFVRKLLITTLILMLTGVLGGCGASNKTTETAKTESTTEQSASNEELVIRFANFKQAVWTPQVVVASKKGFFDQAFEGTNVKVEILDFANGPAANEAFISGEIDIVNGIGDQPTLVGISNGLSTVVLGGTTKQGEGLKVIAKEDADFNTVAELSGKKIGVYIGTYIHKSLIGLLNDVGLSEDDVELVNITSTSDADAAFANDDIDAYLGMNAFYPYDKINNQGFKEITSLKSHPAYSYYVASSDFVNAHRDETAKLLSALVKADNWIKDNPDETYNIIAEFAELDLERVKASIETSDVDAGWDEEYENNLYETASFLSAKGLITSELSKEEIEKHIDTSLLKDAKGNE